MEFLLIVVVVNSADHRNQKVNIVSVSVGFSLFLGSFLFLILRFGVSEGVFVPHTFNLKVVEQISREVACNLCTLDLIFF